MNSKRFHPWKSVHSLPESLRIAFYFPPFACVKICDLRFVDWANLLLQESKGQTYGLSPVWIRTWVRRLKSNENLLPQPSNVHCYENKKNITTLMNMGIFLSYIMSRILSWHDTLLFGFSNQETYYHKQRDYTPTLLHILSLLYLYTLPKGLTRRICLSIKSFSQVVIIFFILTCDPNVQFRGDIVRRNEVLIMLMSQRVKIKRWNHTKQTLIPGKVFHQYEQVDVS